MPIGVIFGETSTQEFSFLFGDADGQRQHQLKFAYVELNLPTDNSKVIARVIDREHRESAFGEGHCKILLRNRGSWNFVSGHDVASIHAIPSQV